MDKPFKTIDEQLDILRSRKLKITNELEARHALQNYGYYEIVNGYKGFILESKQPIEKFKEGETFSHLLALYQLDKEIRNGIMQATLEIELSLRTAIAYTIGEDFGEKQADYLNPQNYRRGRKRKNSSRYPLYQLLDKLHKIANDELEPYRHYRTQHGNIPPWILLKGTTFGNLVNFYKLLKPSQKEKVISICLGLNPRFVVNSVKEMFVQGLDLIHRYRNRSAHSGRIFSYKSDKKMSYNSLFHGIMEISKEQYEKGSGQTGLHTLQTVVGLFQNGDASFLLEFHIYYNSNNHCSIYPQDLELLCSETEISKTIFQEKFSKYEK